MADEAAVETSPTELLGVGRRHLAVRDFTQAVETLAKACELLAQEHGDMGDQCAEAYLWYGKALLGLSREESGVLGDGMPGANAEVGEDDDDQEENADNGEEEKNGEAEVKNRETEANNGEAEEVKENEVQEVEKNEEATEHGSSKPAEDENEHATSTNNEEGDESTVNLENDDDIDNLQLAWEMLDLSRSILYKRVQDGGGDVARAALADVHLALGEVALESETYDKAVLDMQSCLDLQKQLYRNDDRRIAETHYQIGLANSLASNFEDAITHFKNAVNILESRIKTLENPALATEDAIVKKYTTSDPSYTVEGEIKELKELLPEIKEKIQDMMDYKTETVRRVREVLIGKNGSGEPELTSQNGAGSSSSAPKPAATNISHLIKRKRKSSEGEGSAPKRANT